MESSYFRIVSASARMCESENEFWGLLSDALQCLVLETGTGRCENCVNCRLYGILRKGKDDYESEFNGTGKENTDDGHAKGGKLIVSG